MNLEVYARIKDFDNYAVSNHGNVLNIKTGNMLKLYKKDTGYLLINLSKNGKIKPEYIHRLVAFAFLDKIEGKTFVDHIDNCRNNNNVVNLRFCNMSENNRNSKISSNNTSGIKGVSFSKSINKWIAHIYINKKRIHLGCFDSKEDAKIVRQNKAKELYKEFMNDCEK